MKISIRVKLTLWYGTLVALIVMVLGAGVFAGASWGLRKVADRELTSGIEGVEAFLHHKLAIHEMNNLGEELREHASLMPRGKMFRVTDADGSVIYQTDAMAVVSSLSPGSNSLRKATVRAGHRSFQTVSRIAFIGPYTFLLQVAVDQTDYQQLLQGLGWLLILSTPLAAILSAFAGYWMSGKALSPIHQITQTTNSIDASSLDKRLPLLGTNDELDQLSVTINGMLERIAGAYGRVSQFTADASHELRTPVARVRSTTELLLMGLNDSKRVERGLQDILDESDYMTRVIRDLLTLARNGVEEGHLHAELFELGESIHAMSPRAQSLAATRNIAVELQASVELLPVRGNQGVVERTFMILIDNAVKYTPAGGRIWITTWKGRDACGFTVRDNGIGIAERDQVSIFERFFRVDSVRTPKDGASGLGLSIAKSLVALHGGTIKVMSEPGCGSSFEVSFPCVDFHNASSGSGSMREVIAS